MNPNPLQIRLAFEEPAMREDWMMLDIAGEPVPVEVFADMEGRVLTLDEFQRIAEGSHRLAEFLARHQDGDMIVWYTSPDDKWDAHMGSEGYALIRDGYLVDDVLMKMN